MVLNFGNRRFPWEGGDFVTKGMYVSLFCYAARESESGSVFDGLGIMLGDGLVGHYDEKRWDAMEFDNVLCEEVAKSYCKVRELIVKPN